MSTEEIRNAVLQVLHRIAPEADLTTLSPDADLREALDIDSFDFLRFVIALHEALGIDIPETDYPKLATLDATVSYLEAALTAAPPAASS